MNKYEEELRKCMSMDIRDKQGTFLDRIFMVTESELMRIFIVEPKDEVEK